METMTGLHIKNLAVQREGFLAQLVELRIEPGQVVCLVGKSGSGKSTLLHALAGFIPSEGTVLRLGEEIQCLPPEKKKLALVFQQNALFLRMSVFENVEFPLRIQGIDKEKRSARVLDWLQRLGITHLKDKKASDISGGEAQRVQIARALITGFPVALLDEPFSALDIPLKRELRVLLKQLIQSTKTAAFFVTHDVTDVVALADLVCVIDQGKVVFQGSLADARKSESTYLKEIFSSIVA